MDTEFRERLKEIVSRAKGNQGTLVLAKKLGLSLGTVQGWEDGKTIPSIENLAKLAKLTGCKPSDLLSYLNGESLATSQSQITGVMKCLPKEDIAAIVKAGVEMLAAS